jgi:secondary thiamine-phosphate synthase enzyme
MEELSFATTRHTEFIDITGAVAEAISGRDGTAVLVYVPHTTAGVTINEKIDPVLVADLERAFERIVGDDWGFVHDDVDGPNGPSHGRASVAGAQVLIPLRAGAMALGRYQAIFLCEFDGPKARSVYVSVVS